MLCHCHLIDIFSGKKILKSFLSWFPVYIFFPFTLAALKVFSLPLVLNNVIWFALIQNMFLVLGIYGPSWIYEFIIFIIVGKLCSLFIQMYFSVTNLSLFRDTNTIHIKLHKNFPQLTVLPFFFFFFSFCDPFLVVSMVCIQVY